MISMEQNPYEMDTPKDRIDYAGKCGVLLGVMWMVAFLCSIYSLDNPLLGYAGNTVALLSLYALYLIIVRYRAFVTPLRFLSCCKMAWLTCLFAGLLTTLAQYLYFRFIDGGHLMLSLTEMLHDEQYRQAFKQAMPHVTPEDMVQLLSSIKMNDMVLGLWSFNLFISFPMSLTAAIFASLKNVDKYRTKQ